MQLNLETARQISPEQWGRIIAAIGGKLETISSDHDHEPQLRVHFNLGFQERYMLNLGFYRHGSGYRDCVIYKDGPDDAGVVTLGMIAEAFAKEVKATPTITREQMLLVLFMEEYAESIQRAAKAIRFGLDEVQEGQDLNNAQRLVGEIEDGTVIVSLLESKRMISAESLGEDAVPAKIAKVEKWLKYSESLGILKPESKP